MNTYRIFYNNLLLGTYLAENKIQAIFKAKMDSEDNTVRCEPNMKFTVELTEET